jgi:hypothetical protein
MLTVFTIPEAAEESLVLEEAEVATGVGLGRTGAAPADSPTGRGGL